MSQSVTFFSGKCSKWGNKTRKSNDFLPFVMSCQGKAHAEEYLPLRYCLLSSQHQTEQISFLFGMLQQCPSAQGTGITDFVLYWSHSLRWNKCILIHIDGHTALYYCFIIAFASKPQLLLEKNWYDCGKEHTITAWLNKQWNLLTCVFIIVQQFNNIVRGRVRVWLFLVENYSKCAQKPVIPTTF